MDQLRSSASANDLTALLDRALDVAGARETAGPFLPQLIGRERGVRAVLLYGSCLWPSVRGPNSDPDFLVIVESLRAFHRNSLDVLLGTVLPPSVYRLRHGDACAKLSVTTSGQLATQCIATGRDLHLAGRLSKRVGLLWARDASARAEVVAAQVAALRTLAPLALARCDREVALDDFIRVLLGLSYESEIRIVEPHKVAALFAAEREHYRAVARALLADYSPASSEGEAVVARAHLSRRLARSRRRALWRLPKYLITYDGWLDYVLNKLGRAGSPVELSARQRRHPLIFALPVLYRLAASRRLA